jgi:2-C-methyl-D-erythritol 4-phosphate cytidylyltransferase
MSLAPARAARVSFLVPAAGCGARAGLGGNKILAPLRGRTVLGWTLHALLSPAALPAGCSCEEVLVAARAEEFGAVEEVFATLCDTEIPLRVVEGGATRQQSVAALARAARGDLLAVHDAARPLISPHVLRQVLAQAQQAGAAIAATRATDTVKLAVDVVDGAERPPFCVETLDRASIWLAQTPQVFRREILLEALAEAERDGFDGTDCASLVERLLGEDTLVRFPVRLVEGEARNFKITFAADLERAERELQVLAPPPAATENQQ